MLKICRERATAFGVGLVLAGLASERAHAAEGGLNLVPDPLTLGALLVLYVLLIVVLNPLLFKPVFRVMDEREKKIAGTRTRAETLERKSRENLERYEAQVRSGREAAESARRTTLEGARREMSSQIDGARTSAESEIVRARAEVAGALVEARATLREQARELAAQATQQVLGRPL